MGVILNFNNKTMFCIIITNKWTNNSIIYPIIYKTEELANNANIPYSNKNYNFHIKPI